MRLLKNICIIIIFLVGLSCHLFGEELSLTVLYDNNHYKPGLETRWGFSCLVQGTQKTILFDVGGEGAVLLSNMQKLGIGPQCVDTVVLSHIHMDHIGGLFNFLQINPKVTVFMPASFPKDLKRNVLWAGAELVEVGGPVNICEDVYSTGELGDFIKEQSLVVNTSKGLVIVTGCAHPGVVNIVKHVKGMMSKNVYLILGGFHLCWMNPSQLKRVLKGVEKEGVLKVAPSHCSGDQARKMFERAYGEDFILLGAGKEIEIRDAF